MDRYKIVIKRNGQEEQLDKNKIAQAVANALIEVGEDFHENYAYGVAAKVAAQAKAFATVEEIQDLVENELMRGYPSAAKAYILYREKQKEKWIKGWTMTDLERDIYESKYRYKGESFLNFTERVSAGDRAIQKAIRDKKFLPAGRILSGRGLDKDGVKVSLVNCFHPQTSVLTKDGYKLITDIKVGDFVLTRDGTYQRVNHTMVSEFDGELIVFDKGYTNNPIKTTPNHKFYTNEGWKTAEEIYTRNHGKKAQFQGYMAKPTYEMNYKTYYIEDILKEQELDYVVEDEYIRTITRFDKNGTLLNKKGNRMFSKITMSENILYLLGRYLGDGSLTPYKRDGKLSIFQIVFNAETEEADYYRCKSILEDEFGVDVTDNSNEKQGTLVLKVYGEPFGLLINSLVGRKEEKHFPLDYKNSLSLLRGFLDADGYLVNSGSSTSVRVMLANEKLFEELASSLKNNGFNVHNAKEVKNGKDGKFKAMRLQLVAPISNNLIPLMSKVYEDGRHLNYKERIDYIKLGKPSKEYYKGPVYNLSVENNHEYYVEGVLAHNCYVIPEPEDNLESIWDTAKAMARTYSYGGGVGTDISNLRPKGARVSNAARSTSGAVSFMDLYSLTTELIGQSGRRGALMLTMKSSHPDIEDFIKVKRDLTKVNHANISILADKAFMEAVQLNKMYRLEYKVEDTGELISRDIKARDLMREIAYGAWDYAEPGLLFWDRVEGWHLMSEVEDYHLASTNPCVTGDTPILTDKGYLPIGELVGEEVNVWNGNQWSNVTPKITGTNEEILKIEFSNGLKLKCTPYHTFYVMDGYKKQIAKKARELAAGDKLIKFQLPVVKGNKTLPSAYTHGFFSGDGSKHEGKQENRVYLYGDKKTLVDELDVRNAWEEKDGQRICAILEGDYNVYSKTFSPLDNYTIESRLEWLAGLLDSDGTINSKDHALSISSINKEFLEDVLLLVQTLGAHGTIGVMKKAERKLLPDGAGGLKEYNCKESYRLSISAYYTRHLLDLGLNMRRLTTNPQPKRETSQYIQVKNITKQEELEAQVFCFTEPLENKGIFGGVLTGNCGEQPLPASGACCLSAINLGEFVDNPYQEALAEFNFSDFETMVMNGIVYLNGVLDESIDLHPLEEQKIQAEKYREIGLGVFGLADMFIKMGIRYGSKKSLDLLHKVFDVMINAALRQSALLAKEFGAAPGYNEKVLESEFLKKNANPEVFDLVAEYGLRNTRLLTVAPTGSTATMLGASGGVEPLFMISYKRRTQSINDGVESEYVVYSDVIKGLMEAKGLKNESELPDYVVTAHDISPSERVVLQGVIQQYVDSAISSTINLPKEATVKDVENLFMDAYSHGLKGVTVFRDGGARLGILTSDDKEEDNSPKCPECGGKLIKAHGCEACEDCGYSP